MNKLNTAGRRLTVAEFAALPSPDDGTRLELVRGEIITMTPPKGPHGIVCALLAAKLVNFVQERKLGWVMSNDTGFVVSTSPDTVRGPDVAFWSRQGLPEVPSDDYIRTPPDLAVEVLSPSEPADRLLAKLREYLECGVGVVWLVDPTLRSVMVVTGQRAPVSLGVGQTLTGEGALAGFACPIADLFP